MTKMLLYIINTQEWRHGSFGDVIRVSELQWLTVGMKKMKRNIEGDTPM